MNIMMFVYLLASFFPYNFRHNLGLMQKIMRRQKKKFGYNSIESNLDAYSLGHSELYSSGISGVIDFETRKLGFFYLIEMKKKNVES